MSFAEFVLERRYLHNVSPATVSWYTHALNWLPSETPTQTELKDTVLRMREKGLKETGCNAAIRAINAYLHWNTGAERKCGAGCTHPRIQQLKEPEIILPTLTDSQVKLHALDADGVDKVLTKHQATFQKHFEHTLRKMNR